MPQHLHASTSLAARPTYVQERRTHAPRAMAEADMARLSDWFAGKLALSRAEAHALLEQAVESGRLARNRQEFVAAIKALATGPGSWPHMGYRLLPEH